MKRSHAAIIVATALALVLAGGSAARTLATKTIVVNSLGDAPDPTPKDGVCNAKFTMLTKPGKVYCTLRAAVQTVNFGPRGTYVIKLPAGTFHLSVPGAFEEKAAKGDFDVLQANVTVIGQGPAETTIDGGGIDRVFDVSAFAGLALKNLRITGGALKDSGSGGGAVRVRGTLSAENVLIENSNASQVGGGIFVDKTGGVDLTRVTLQHNVALIGAGIDVWGNVSMTNVTIVGNNASTEAGGIRVAQSGKASLLHVTIAGNTSGPFHADATEWTGKLTMASSIVSGKCAGPAGSHFPYPQRNVVTDKNCADDPPVADPGLLAPAASGNVVPTMALKPTSPAVDFAFANTCPPVDARGVKRPQGAGCDAGAYELVK
jgi:CSLREA domain-containing protein